MRPSRPKPDNAPSRIVPGIESRPIRILARPSQMTEAPLPPIEPSTSSTTYINNPQPALAPGFRPRQPRPTLQQLEERRIQAQAFSEPISTSPAQQYQTRPPAVPPLISSSLKPELISRPNEGGSSSSIAVTTNKPISHSSSSSQRTIDAAALYQFKKDINDARASRLDERDSKKKLIHNSLLMRIFNTLYLYTDYTWLAHLDHNFLRWTLKVISETLETVVKMRQFGVDLNLSDREFGGNQLRKFLIPFFENCFRRIELLNCEDIQKNDFVNFCLYIGKLMGKLPAKFIERIERDLNANVYNETDLSMLRNAFSYLCTLQQVLKGQHPYQELNTRLAKKRAAEKNTVIDEHSVQSIMAACLSSANMATTDKLFKILLTDSDDVINNFSVQYVLTLIWDFRRLESILKSENKTTEKIELIRENWQAVKDHLLLKLYAIFTSDEHFADITIKDHINNLLCFYNLGVADGILQEYLNRIDSLDTCARLAPMELGKVKEVVKKRNLNFPENIKKRFTFYPSLYRNEDDKPPEQEVKPQSSAPQSYVTFNPALGAAIAETEKNFLNSAMRDMFIPSEPKEAEKETSESNPLKPSSFNPNNEAFMPSTTEAMQVDAKELSQFIRDITRARSFLLGENDKTRI